MLMESETTGVELAPDGWEFDERDTSEWNWLMVKGEVRSKAGSWQFRDALFTPKEGLRFADWLEQLDTLAAGAEFTFTEPEVRFERGERRPSGAVELKAYFVFNASPPWITSDSEEETEVVLVLAASAATTAAAALRREISALATER
jgi:hypothetical protein